MRNRACLKQSAALLLACGFAAFGADWGDVRRVTAGQKIEVTTRDGQSVRGTFVSTTSDNLVIREESGEQSIGRGDIKRVRVHDAARRIRRGIMWTVIGAGAGAGAGAAACPYCPNEGNTSPYIGPGAAGGAAIGALGFLTDPYRTIYRSK